MCLTTLGLAFQVLKRNTAAVTSVEMTVSALNVLSCIKVFWPLALGNICITDRNLLLSGNQVEEIKLELIRYKEEVEASDNYLCLSMCSALTMEVIDEVCSTLQGLCTLEETPSLEKRTC